MDKFSWVSLTERMREMKRALKKLLRNCENIAKDYLLQQINKA